MGRNEGGRNEGRSENPSPEADPVRVSSEAGRATIDQLLERLTREAKGSSPLVECEIASGGQGTILRVLDETLHRRLAMKVMHAGTSESNESSRPLGRFIEEAQITGQLDHPGIVPVHELGVDSEGRVFFTMRFVKGRDLRQIIELVNERAEGWNLTRALGAMLKVCEAMAFAHRKGVIHRDLKPGNIMIGRFGEVYVMDWGLARVLDQPDRHDLRVATDPEPISMVESDRRAKSSPDELLTMDGAAIGTPAYMPPEQAMGLVNELDERSDVYSVGALLYHLLGGQPPYVPPSSRLSGRQVLWRVIEGPPVPLATLNPKLPAELVAICEKAMARRAAARYRDMSELREDLAAYLEHRVVTAYETGALAELSKWVQRNRALAGALVAVVVTLAAALVLKVQSDQNRVLASEQSLVAERRGDEVVRLSGFQRLEELEREVPLLWPALPEMIPLFDDWLDRARALATELEIGTGGYPGHRARLAELQALAENPAPGTVESSTLRRLLEPRLEALSARLRDLDLRIAAREGRAAPADPDQQASAAEGLATLCEEAWKRVSPDRQLFGQEAHGLELARAAFERVDGDEDFARASEVLAWALFANGQEEQALKKADDALSMLPDEWAGPLQVARRRIPLEAQALPGLLAMRGQLEAEIAALPLPSEFNDPEARVLHQRLSELVAKLERIADPEHGAIDGLSPELGLGIARRREFAATVLERSVDGPEAKRRWSEAIAAIADRSRHPPYEGLEIRPQVGLLPIGPDPDSGLWEFAHLFSGQVPERDAEGRLALGEDTGIVLVLLPGGPFWMGAQRFDPAAPNYDSLAQDSEMPVHRVELSPFFLSKYELTQGQWLRFCGSNPSQDRPEIYDPAWNAYGQPGTLLHPVERVGWLDCLTLLHQMELELPSEAQWEYAARAGTAWPWWTGPEAVQIEGAANILDSRAKTEYQGEPISDTWLDDGYVTHAPVGSFRANPFGFHDILGNVWEWCLDGNDISFYARSPVLDPVLEPLMCPLRSGRGGGFNTSTGEGRVSMRGDGWPDRRDQYLGCRPARALEP